MTNRVEQDSEIINVHKPYVEHDNFKEITFRGVVLSIVLAVVLGAANVYLGLLVGLTVSASIPASVMSMAILRCFPDSNILENNIVQTAASAGESLAAGVIFTLPGLVIINSQAELGNPVFEGVQGWDSFMGTNYIYGTLLALLGGVLGIAWSIPLRKALIVEIDPPLAFPEGVATAQVLKSGESSGKSVYAVALGGIAGSITTLMEVMGLYDPVLGFGWLYQSMYPTYFAVNIKASLMGVGYIIGPKIAFVLFLGTVLQYMVAIPVSAVINGRYNETEWDTTTNGPFTAKNLASTEFRETRYIGVGLMIVGGVWSLFSIRKALYAAVKFGVKQFRVRGQDSTDAQKRVVRYDRDIPFHLVLGMVVFSAIPLYILFSTYSNEWGWCIIMALVVSLVSFLFSAVAAYMAGLVGSSNNPISGTTICSSLVLSALILAMFGADNPIGPSTAVIMCTAVACACAISGDNMQDLKSGHILGATPWKQEVIMLVGVSATSFVVCPILELLHSAYVLGVGLQAPQASIIATIPVGLITGELPWTYIGVGAGLGVVIILIDLILEKRKCSFRLPVLAFAAAFYLPIYYLTPIFLGSLVHFFAGTSPEQQASDGVLYSAGLVAGDSIMGILCAIPIAASGNGAILQVISDPVVWPVLFPLALLLGSMTYIAKYQPFAPEQVEVADDKVDNNTPEKDEIAQA